MNLAFVFLVLMSRFTLDQKVLRSDLNVKIFDSGVQPLLLLQVQGQRHRRESPRNTGDGEAGVFNNPAKSRGSAGN